MNLGHIERGAKLSIVECVQMRAVSAEYEAVFRYLDGDKLFVVQCAGLYDNFDAISPDSSLRISYTSEPNTYSFSARALSKQRGYGMLLLEQLTRIETICSRRYDRDELRMTVMVYGLPEAMLAEPVFEKPNTYPDMNDVTYDISAGGVCVISNTLLASEHDPFYLVEFSLSDKDRFLLPTKLVRRSNYARIKVGRYDYGFQFIFDHMPDEKGRLSRSILSRKLSLR